MLFQKVKEKNIIINIKICCNEEYLYYKYNCNNGESVKMVIQKYLYR